MGREVYPTHIARMFRDGDIVEFHLVAKGRDGGPGDFYIMKDKVSIRLYRKFAEARPLQTEADLKAGADVRLPMMGMTAQEAYDYAQWLGGIVPQDSSSTAKASYGGPIRVDLPTSNQWDKAAGLFDRAGREGPYLKTWAGLPGEIAIARTGPMPVGTATHDKSWCECRDMAGNGFEWTRSAVTGEPIPFPLPPGASRSIELRGQPYDSEQPLRFVDLELKNFGSRICDDRKPGVSFRVVLDIL